MQVDGRGTLVGGWEEGTMVVTVGAEIKISGTS